MRNVFLWFYFFWLVYILHFADVTNFPRQLLPLSATSPLNNYKLINWMKLREPEMKTKPTNNLKLKVLHHQPQPFMRQYSLNNRQMNTMNDASSGFHGTNLDEPHDTNLFDRRGSVLQKNNFPFPAFQQYSPLSRPYDDSIFSPYYPKPTNMFGFKKNLSGLEESPQTEFQLSSDSFEKFNTEISPTSPPITFPEYAQKYLEIESSYKQISTLLPSNKYKADCIIIPPKIIIKKMSPLMSNENESFDHTTLENDLDHEPLEDPVSEHIRSFTSNINWGKNENTTQYATFEHCHTRVTLHSTQNSKRDSIPSCATMPVKSTPKCKVFSKLKIKFQHNRRPQKLKNKHKNSGISNALEPKNLNASVDKHIFMVSNKRESVKNVYTHQPLIKHKKFTSGRRTDQKYVRKRNLDYWLNSPPDETEGGQTVLTELTTEGLEILDEDDYIDYNDIDDSHKDNLSYEETTEEPEENYIDYLTELDEPEVADIELRVTDMSTESAEAEPASEFPEVTESPVKEEISLDKDTKQNIEEWLQTSEKKDMASKIASKKNQGKKWCEKHFNKTCVCSIKKVLSDISEIIRTSSNPKTLHKAISTVKCSEYIPISSNYDLSSDIKPRLIGNKRKELIIDDKTGPKEVTEDTLEELLVRGGKREGVNYYVFPSTTLEIPCFTTDNIKLSPNFADSASYKWTHGNQKAITEGRILEDISHKGVLKITDVTYLDSDNYTCTVNYMSPDTEKTTTNSFLHTVNAKVRCDQELLEMFELYLPQQIEKLICNGKTQEAVCSVEIYNPLCHSKCKEDKESLFEPKTIWRIRNQKKRNSKEDDDGDEMEMSLNYELDLKTPAHFIPEASNKTSCNPHCQQSIALRMIQILRDSFKDSLKMPVSASAGVSFEPIFSLSNLKTIIACDGGLQLVDGFCVPCGPGTYSVEGSSQCSPCPPGTYQEGIASKCCQECPHPFKPGCFDIAHSKNFIIVSLITLIILMIIFIIYLLWYFKSSELKKKYKNRRSLQVRNHRSKNKQRSRDSQKRKMEKTNRNEGGKGKKIKLKNTSETTSSNDTNFGSETGPPTPLPKDF